MSFANWYKYVKHQPSPNAVSIVQVSWRQLREQSSVVEPYGHKWKQLDFRALGAVHVSD